MGNYSNGEYFREATAHDRKLRKLILEKADENARKLGMDRREFMASSMGMATTLWCIQFATACSSDKSTTGSKGNPVDGGSLKDGGLCVPPAAMFDENAACTVVGNQGEFIFDVQTHWFSQADTVHFPASVEQLFGGLFASTTEQKYVDDIFMQSDTTMTVLTAWPGATCPDNEDSSQQPCGLPLSNESMQKSRDHINQLACNTQRVLQHVQILPNDLTGIDKQMEIMNQIYCEKLAYGWKMYPGFASNSIDPRGTTGYFLTEDKPRKLIEHGLSLGLNRFCVHKGLPIGNFFESTHNYPSDIGVVANDYKNANFIIYHSAICAGFDQCDPTFKEGPFDPNDPNPKGTNALIKSLLDNNVQPNSNVYAEVGSALNQIQNDTVQAQHFFGKLMKYVGTDRVVWGTDCVIYNSPQPFIQWFRALNIGQDLQSQYGYPALDDTPEGKTNRAKIFGLNSAKLYGIDVNAKRCQINSCTQAMWKQQLEDELGSGRYMFKAPGGPRTWAEYTEHSRQMAKSFRPG
jgi:hypothetical protein